MTVRLSSCRFRRSHTYEFLRVGLQCWRNEAAVCGLYIGAKGADAKCWPGIVILGL